MTNAVSARPSLERSAASGSVEMRSRAVRKMDRRDTALPVGKWAIRASLTQAGETFCTQQIDSIYSSWAIR